MCVCGKTNTLNHSLICKKGGHVSMRHNSLVSLITKLLVSAGCRDVVTEPLLLPTAGVTLSPGSNTAYNPRADVSARNIWNPLERAFLDVRVYHAQAPFNRNLKTIPRMYSQHEEQKKRAYNAQILEAERGIFTPLVFSTSGGWERRLKPYSRELQQRWPIRPVRSTWRQSPSSGRDCASTF